MKKRKHAVLLALGALLFTGHAAAVSLNPRGLGQVLIYPYYTVNKGQDTLLSVTNTGDLGKVVKISFNEGYNGRTVMDFHVFLSPYDAWTATVTAAGEGARIVSNDRSCVLPMSAGMDIHTTGFHFRSSSYDGQYIPGWVDGGPTGLARTREGSIRMITVGDVVPGSRTDDLIAHQQTGNPGERTPAGCAELSLMHGDLVVPTNTLAGSAGIVNVGEGTYYPYNAEALADFTGVVLFSSVSAEFDQLALVNSYPLLDRTEASVFVDGKPITLSYERGIDAVSAVLMADNLYNEYIVSENIGARTDWVVTFPTKHFHVDPFYTPIATPPFVEPFDKGESKVEITTAIYDREEGHAFIDDIGVPVGRKPDILPYEVNVIDWRTSTEANELSGVFGSKLRSNLKPWGNDGWARLNLAAGDGGHALPPDKSGKVLYGLPAIGFMAYNLINANAQPGKLANYGGVFPHRTTSACGTATGTPELPCH